MWCLAVKESEFSRGNCRNRPNANQPLRETKHGRQDTTSPCRLSAEYVYRVPAEGSQFLGFCSISLSRTIKAIPSLRGDEIHPSIIDHIPLLCIKEVESTMPRPGWSIPRATMDHEPSPVLGRSSFLSSPPQKNKQFCCLVHLIRQLPATSKPPCSSLAGSQSSWSSLRNFRLRTRFSVRLPCRDSAFLVLLLSCSCLLLCPLVPSCLSLDWS
ncbi:hypothetical protein BDW59DRAFT_62530 [Aspergillus cavernicola]|uniref:Uncharacterized protein n=1 Tax=Aspergillus cavernicola TaxID=176166 RepID=A0ABR4IIF5_9EURO